MKAKLGIFGVVLLAFALLMAGCSGSKGGPAPSASGPASKAADASPSGSSGEKKPLTVGLYISGNLGDAAFNDAANAGLEKIKLILGAETKVVEGGQNQADWASGFEQMVSSKKYEILIAGSSQMLDITQDLAKRYPDQKFVFFDEPVVDVPNIYSVTYDQKEGSFLAGAFAGLVTTSTELKGANPDKVVGFIGGMDIPILHEFQDGFEQGAKYIDPDIKLVASYVGDFVNAPKGKELALAQHSQQKADIIFGVAGGASFGQFEAAKELGMYAIGADANQNGIQPGTVLTSMVKNVDGSLLRAVDLYTKGQLKFGTTENIGFLESGVGLAKDDLYTKYVPESIRKKVDEIQGKLQSGEIKVQ